MSRGLMKRGMLATRARPHPRENATLPLQRDGPRTGDDAVFTRALTLSLGWVIDASPSL